MIVLRRICLLKDDNRKGYGAAKLQGFGGYLDEEFANALLDDMDFDTGGKV